MKSTTLHNKVEPINLVYLLWKWLRRDFFLITFLRIKTMLILAKDTSDLKKWKNHNYNVRREELSLNRGGIYDIICNGTIDKTIRRLTCDVITNQSRVSANNIKLSEHWSCQDIQWYVALWKSSRSRVISTLLVYHARIIIE